jgi:type II secretory pathway component PulJ
MTPEVLSQLAVGAVMGLLYWSLNRNVSALDEHIKAMAAKVDDLHRAETAMQVRVAELSVRMQHTESMLAGIELELEKLRGQRA